VCNVQGFRSAVCGFIGFHVRQQPNYLQCLRLSWHNDRKRRMKIPEYPGVRNPVLQIIDSGKPVDVCIAAWVVMAWADG